MTEAKATGQAAQENPKVTHPLMRLVPTVLDSFEGWYARWQATDFFEEKLGLLHSLTVDNGWWQRQELVFTLLDVADGFNDSRNFSGSDIDTDRSGGYPRQIAEDRQTVAKKAFSVLCLRFFGERQRGDEPLWYWMLLHEALFAKVLWFLRRDAGIWRYHMYNRVRESSNEGENHYYKIFRTFMFRFAKLGWEFRWPTRAGQLDDQVMKLVHQRISAAKLQFIDILYELGELRWLGQKDLELDEETIKILTEKVLGKDLNLPRTDVGYNEKEFRKPETLEEALLDGSVPAEIVLLHNIRAKECKRIGALIEVARLRHEEDVRAAELARLEDERRKLEDKARKLGKKP